MSFAPLHVYSGYSFEKSGLKIDQYVERAKKLGYHSLALTDFSTLSGIPSFVHLCQKEDIKPIIGEDLYFANLLFTFIVLNEAGYRNLLKLNYESSKGNLTLKFLKENNDGLAVILSIQNDAIKKAVITDEKEFPRKMAKLSDGIKNFYLGIEYNEDIDYINQMREFAEHYSYDSVAFPVVKYVIKEDAIVLRMMESIASKEVLNQKKLSGEQYLKSIDELSKIYTAKELNASEEIVKKINFNFVAKRGKLISFENNYGLSSDDYLKQLALAGLKKLNKVNQKYLDRLTYELSIIKKMGYSDYFLIVQDYIKFARKNNIAVGPGRGSAAGSLVSYALGITVPDPVENNLLFERFLNEHRQSMPDIDVDFSDERREDVVKYIKDKYGSNKVANIVSFHRSISLLSILFYKHLMMLAKSLIMKNAILNYSLDSSKKKEMINSLLEKYIKRMLTLER